MGIKGLFSFLNKWAQPVPPLGRVGLDLFYFLYQSRGDMGAMKRLLAVYDMTRAHAVLDGAAKSEPSERRDELDARKEVRKRAWNEMERLREAPLDEMDATGREILREKVMTLGRQAWTPSRNYIEEVVTWLEGEGAVVHRAEGEADGYLVNLEREGVIDVIVSNDSDVIVLGAKRLVRPVNTLFDTDYIRDQMGFSQRQWDDFLLLCKNMRELDVVLAYSLISVYKRKEMAVERWEEVNGKRLMR
jgi:5'-3' exonuclease